MDLQYHKPTTIEAKTEAFFKIVEAGDMTLFQTIQRAIAVFGYTRAGKTTSCHLLCRSPLKAQIKNGEFIYVPSTRKFDTAIVGTSHESETQIPNMFDAMVKDGNNLKNIIVLDQPGYGDTYGFHRIFSNGYFHYRTFSKTPNLKFVLAIWMNDLRGTAQKFKLTIKNFINTFKDWNSVKQGVLKATCFLITKADPQTTEASLVEIVTNLKNAVGSMGANQRARYQQFIDDMLTKKKIFFIPRPTQANQKAEDNIILQKIYDKTQFWQREVKKNIVEMGSINFSVTQEILLKLRNKDEQYFRQQYEHYIEYTQKRLDNMIVHHKGSLTNIVKLLQIDSKSNNDSHQFLQAIEDFNKKHDQFLQKYSKKRDTVISNLFKNVENQQLNQSTQEQLKEMRSIYFIKKFKVLDYIRNIYDTLPASIETGRSIEELQNFSNIFMQMFKKFSILGISKNDREKTIYKYSYIVQRLIEQSKILTLILFHSEEAKNQFTQINVSVIREDIFRLLCDKFITLVLGQMDTNKLKKEFIEQFDFNSLFTVNEQIIAFLQSIAGDSDQIAFKIAQVIIEFEKKLFDCQNNPQTQQKKFIMEKLYTCRNNFYKIWNKLKQSGSLQDRQKCAQVLMNLTKSLANVLQSLHMYNQSRECFRTINDAESIFKIYQLESSLIAKDPKLYRELLIKYANEANLYYRKQLALQCCQKAYAFSSNIEEIKQVSQTIVSICTQKKQDQLNDPYLSRMYNFEDSFFQDFSPSLKTTIEDQCGLELS